MHIRMHLLIAHARSRTSLDTYLAKQPSCKQTRLKHEVALQGVASPHYQDSHHQAFRLSFYERKLCDEYFLIADYPHSTNRPVCSSLGSNMSFAGSIRFPALCFSHYDTLLIGTRGPIMSFVPTLHPCLTRAGAVQCDKSLPSYDWKQTSDSLLFVSLCFYSVWCAR